MSDYQVIARRYRPKSFREVLGQDAIVTTLKNAIKHDRLAHAYLFCGSRGTGKTTLARIFAKTLNCHQPTPDGEPCNQCSSCKEITSGSSLDVLEIDGASHRGIENIRQINDTVGYAASAGKYKIYIIDEVHMLTKEAFNALLKTLEEPPAKVKFFFATTEPHKVLPTILSRCQRFNLNRIPLDKIIQKLNYVAKELGCDIDEEALRLIAVQAEGGLRDAESLLDQIIAFEDGKITANTVASILGLMTHDAFFELDQAGKIGNLSKAFEISHQVFSQGKDLLHFIEGLIEHFRHLLLIKLSGKDSPYLILSDKERTRYEASSVLYTQEQCASILDLLLEKQSQIRFSPSGQIALEALLIQIMRTHHRLPVDILVKRLIELEQAVGAAGSAIAQPTLSPAPMPEPLSQPPISQPQPQQPKATPLAPTPATVQPLSPPPAPAQAQPSPILVSSVNEDPTPTSADLGIKKKVESPPLPPTPQPAPQPQTIAPVLAMQPKQDTSPKPQIPQSKQSHYDTMLQFASVELEGKVQKNR
jgi:DNA polymerase III subunit gamma/tau